MTTIENCYSVRHVPTRSSRGDDPRAHCSPKTPPEEITLHEANGDRRGFVSADDCASLARAGKGFAVRSRQGRLVRFVLYPESHQREGVAALRNASRTTRPMRADGSLKRGAGQLLGNSRTLREHNLAACEGYAFGQVFQDRCVERDACICERVTGKPYWEIPVNERLCENERVEFFRQRLIT